MAEGNDNLADSDQQDAGPLLRKVGRTRTVVFLTLNLIGFAMANAFWRYLATGQWFRFATAEYHRELVSPLGALFVGPLSIFTHPWMIPVLSLLLGLVIVVPILVAVLYRQLHAMLFVLVVAVLGHGPVLALAQAVGCVVATRTRLRSEMPFAAALLGMVPLGLYVYVFAFAAVDFPAALPLQRWVLSLPAVIAMVVAILATAVVLLLAKVTAFRPGVVWPVLVVFLAGPMALFHIKIGADELEYTLIANRLAPSDAVFHSVTLDSWRQSHSARRAGGLGLEALVNRDLDRRKQALADKCQAFLETHRHSDRAPAVLWIQAQLRSLLLDDVAFRGELVKYSAAHPLQASAPLWRRLLHEHRGAPQAALAAWRLGELALRRGQAKQADEFLRDAAERLRSLLAQTPAEDRPERTPRIFSPAASVPADRGLEYYEEALFALERLIWLMEQNNVLTDARCAEAMAAYLDLNPRNLGYSEGLFFLAAEYEDTKMEDNLKLAVALADRNRYDQANALMSLADYELTDAAIEASFALGGLTMRTIDAPALALDEKLKKPEEYFKAVVAARENPWQQRAAEHLAWLKKAQPAAKR